MIQITQLKLPADHTPEALKQKAAKVLRDYLENREMPAVVYAAICLAVDRLEGGRSRSVMEYREGRV